MPRDKITSWDLDSGHWHFQFSLTFDFHLLVLSHFRSPSMALDFCLLSQLPQQY